MASLHISRVQIIQEIQEDEQVLQRCRMEPAMLPPLVEHNPGIATAVRCPRPPLDSKNPFQGRGTV